MHGTRVDAYDPAKGNDPTNGYQRMPSATRMNQAAEFYGEGVANRAGKATHDRRGLMPNPIIANIRSDKETGDDAFENLVDVPNVHLSSADPAVIDAQHTRVSEAAGHPRRAPSLTGGRFGVQGVSGAVDPIAAWNTVTQPKPLLEPATSSTRTTG